MSYVTPVMGEIGRYHCQSDTNPNQSHLCDIIDNECGCADFVCRQRKYREKTNRPYLCKHLRAARTYCLEFTINTMRGSRLSQ